MTDMSPAPRQRLSMEVVEPLNMMAMSQLGEPDPAAISRSDLLSAVSFDRQGQILSVGDRGGRVICFSLAENASGQQEFEYLTEFQAHTKSFDVLSSSDISETVNCIEWINYHQKMPQPALLSSNSREIKLFRIVNKREIRSESVKKKMQKGRGIGMPRTKVLSESKEGKHIASFKTGSEQHIHSLALSPDTENFICADENRINLWNLERSGKNPVYNLIDYNRKKVTEEDEIITKAKFSQQSTMFLYTTSKGHVRVCDFRESSNFQHRASLEFNVNDMKPNKRVTAFDSYLSNISDACFVPGQENLVVSRDYLNTCLWDMRLAQTNTTSAAQGMIVDSTCRAKPIYSASVTDYMSTNLI